MTSEVKDIFYKIVNDYVKYMLRVLKEYHSWFMHWKTQSYEVKWQVKIAKIFRQTSNLKQINNVLGNSMTSEVKGHFNKM